MNLKNVPKIEADILIIGGGSAGTMAAVRAKEVNPDQTVVIFEKGDFQFSGSIPRGMDALNIVALPGIASPEDFVAANRAYCAGICDDPKSLVLAQRSYPLMKTLIDWGVAFPRDNGNYDVTTLHPYKKFTVTMDSPDLKRILVEKAIDSGCRVENRTVALKLLKEGETVCGAIGMNVRSGEIIVCVAKSVILSAGGTARFGMPQNGEIYGTYDFPGNTGDGYLLGYRSGAKLTSMEHTMCYVILKDVETPGTAMMIEKGAKIIDAAGNALFEEGFYDLSEVNRIQNSPAGPLRLRLSHLPEEKIEEIEHLIFTLERPSCERFLKGRNVDMRKSDVELATTELFLCGGHGQAGLTVDETAATTVAGLYAAGDTAPLGRGYLTGAFVFGQLAAENGTAFARDRGQPVPEEKGFLTFMEKLDGYRKQQYNPVPVRDFEFKLRKTITDYLMPPKNEYKLNILLERIEQFRKDMKTQVRIETQRNLNETFEVENILASAYLSTTSSLERKESRWGFWHKRGDYPHKDDSNWVKHIDLQINPNAQEPEISYRSPVRIEEIGDFA